MITQQDKIDILDNLHNLLYLRCHEVIDAMDKIKDDIYKKDVNINKKPEFITDTYMKSAEITIKHMIKVSKLTVKLYRDINNRD